MTRPVVGTCLLALCFAGFFASGARADEATNRNLLERGRAELQEAQRLYFGGQRGPARQKAARATLLFEQVETQRQADPEAAFYLIQAAVFAGDPKAAARWLEVYASRNPYGARDSRLHYARGLILLLLEHRSAAALASLEEMQRLDGRNPDRGRDTLYYKALMAEGARRIEEREAGRAVPILQQAVRTALRIGDRRKELAARSNVGIAWQVSGRPEEARQVFDRLAKEDAQNLVWPFHLGMALDALDRPADATAAYDLVIGGLEEKRAPAPLLPFLRQAYLKKGRAARQQADAPQEAATRRAHLETARRSFERYVELEPKDARGHGALGALLYEAFARPFEALPFLESAYALDPVCDAALAMMIEIGRRYASPAAGAPGDIPTDDDWGDRLAAWEKDYASHREQRARERKARAARSLDGSDGCE